MRVAGRLGRLAHSIVVSLRPALQRIDQRNVRDTKIECRQGSSVGRLYQGRVRFRYLVDLFVAVSIEIQTPRFDVRWASLLGSVDNFFRCHQLALYAGPQMRGIYAAKDAVPVRVVALRAQHVRSGLVQRPAQGQSAPHRLAHAPDLR